MKKTSDKKISEFFLTWKVVHENYSKKSQFSLFNFQIHLYCIIQVISLVLFFNKYKIYI